MDKVTINIPPLDFNSIQDSGTIGSAPSAAKEKPSQPKSKQAILEQLLARIKPIDFEEELGASPRQKYIIVEVVEKVLETAKAAKLDLAMHQEFLYLFTGKHWQQAARGDVKNFLVKSTEKMGYPKQEARYYEFGDKLLKQFFSSAHLSTPEKDAHQVLVNFQNGTLEINANKKPCLREHRPDDFLTYVLPFDYSPNAKAPQFQAFLQQMLPYQTSQAVLAEFVAYCFTPLKLEKVLLLHGSGANGKSVVFDVLQALLGRENVSCYSLSNLAEEHNRAMIASKLLNYGSEISAGIGKDLFKTLASGEPVQARLKYGNPFQMENYAKLMFNANELPKDTEQTEGFFRRFLIVPFSVHISEELQDKNLAKRIIESELPGVFAWVLQGLERLNKQQNFTPCPRAKEALQQYRKESDSVALYLEDYGYTPNALAEPTPLKCIFSEYRTFCADSGFRNVGTTNFSNRLKKHGFETVRRSSGTFLYCQRNPQ